MYRVVTVLVGIAGFMTSAASFAAELSITQGNSTAVIRVGEEVVGTYRFGDDLPKPYLIAVSAPGALDILVSELDQPPADEHAPGNKVFVAVESAELRDGAKGSATGKLSFGEIVNISAARDGWLQIDGGQTWVAARDVVPLKAMVTRLVNLQPSGIKDRAHPDYYDHPHHKGVWNSIDEVNDIKFCAEQGKIATASVEVVKGNGNPVELKVVNHWLGEDGQPLLKEEARITVDARRLFTYDITFTAAAKPVTFDDTKEGMFAIRMPNSMREQFAKGPIVNAEGLQGSKECWGKTSPWVDYVGPVGGHNFGVTLMDHPDNPRKSRYHVRDYGLFSMSPFGDGSYSKGRPDAVPANPLTLPPGESVRFRYGLYVHRGDVTEGRVPEVFASFVQSAR